MTTGTATNTADAELNAARLDILDLIAGMRRWLKGYGFEPYRVEELLHPRTGRHVRVSYAGGEWRVISGQLPNRPLQTRSVADLAVRPDAQHGFTLRERVAGRALPTPGELGRAVAGIVD